MAKQEIAKGVAHDVPGDLQRALTSDVDVLARWNSLTPLARNEWICWIQSVKKSETKKQHIERLRGDLLKGKRRPCCWMGCVHRTDKAVSPSQKFILSRQSKKR